MSKKKDAMFAELAARHAKLEGQLHAHREWFTCSAVRGESPTVLDVEGTGMTVHVHGVQRAAGGVCLVHVEGKPCGEPVLLDDLAADWSRDPGSDIRYAAHRLLQDREESISVKRAS